MNTRILLAIVSAATLVSSIHSQDADGFTPLFNGKDLAGWRPVNVAPTTFSVRDGMIVTSGVPTGFMATDRMYENFIVELDWRHLKEGGNSGLFIWGEGLPAPGVPYAKGIEVQVLDLGYETQNPSGAWQWFTSHGDIFPIWGATMTPVEPVAKSGKRSFPNQKRVRPSPEWNHYRVVCQQGEIRLSVNGKEVTFGRECVPRKGFICLESEGSEAHFKNIRIKELPSSNTPAEQTAEAYEGFRQLLNGVDFTGWKLTDTNRSAWKVNGLHVSAQGGVDGENLDLWTEKSFRDFTLVADWRLRPKSDKKGTDKLAAGADRKPELAEGPAVSGISLRGSSKAQVAISSRATGSGDISGYREDTSLPIEVRTACSPKTNADSKPGQWNRYFITMRGDRCTVILNGQKIVEEAPLPGVAAEGPLGLHYHHEEIEFANLFLKEL
ncbi:MAG: 3-keto-disaccharide hydrolase [Roseimicrobium sp.]